MRFSDVWSSGLGEPELQMLGQNQWLRPFSSAAFLAHPPPHTEAAAYLISFVLKQIISVTLGNFKIF